MTALNVHIDAVVARDCGVGTRGEGMRGEGEDLWVKVRMDSWRIQIGATDKRDGQSTRKTPHVAPLSFLRMSQNLLQWIKMVKK